MRRIKYTFNLSAALSNLIIIGLLLIAIWRIDPNTIVATSWLDVIIAAILYWFMLTIIAAIWIVIMGKAFELRLSDSGIIIITAFFTICAYLSSIISLYGVESLMNNFAIISPWRKFIIAGIVVHSIQVQAYSQ